MMLCLSRAELTEWSGYRQRSRVAAWLKQNGVQFLMGADGWPRVRREAAVATPRTLTKSVPNINALLEMQGGRHGKTAKTPARSA